MQQQYRLLYNYTYVAEAESTDGLDGFHSGSSLSGVLDEMDGVIPHGVGHAVHVFAESQAILKVCLEMARLQNAHTHTDISI